MSSEQRKVLEDIQRTKRLLKEGTAASLGMHTGSVSVVTPSSSSPAFPSSTPSSSSPAGIGEMMMSPGMRSAMQVLAQANVTSFGYFIPQDSHFGNSILPVLPRIEAPTPVGVVVAPVVAPVTTVLTTPASSSTGSVASS